MSVRKHTCSLTLNTNNTGITEGSLSFPNSSLLVKAIRFYATPRFTGTARIGMTKGGVTAYFDIVVFNNVGYNATFDNTDISVEKGTSLAVQLTHDPVLQSSVTFHFEGNETLN